ncbi:hypothetical protein [Paenibacillus sp. URB8-2]|uniref:hypothetical protein n=1 Tax=Paenibacillus sp. URB8-2 TaxID=2741301 RepID=UPI0015B90B87|nr:hypothetical protein [Paenibacillus sp. URB8-2]BCG60581.1 hypothetical protein PUR_40060 [Paenibacillus sp. URB8-2]
MSEAMFELILNELKEINTVQHEMRVQQQEVRAELQEMRAERQQMRAEHRTDYGELKQALFETLETVKRIEAAQQAFEQATAKQIIPLESGLELLNRRQFKLEVEMDILKSR